MTVDVNTASCCPCQNIFSFFKLLCFRMVVLRGYSIYIRISHPSKDLRKRVLYRFTVVKIKI